MRTEALHIGQRVKHPQHGLGTVQALNTQVAEIRFEDGVLRSVAPEISGLQPAEPQTAISGMELPLAQFVRETVEATIASLGLERPDGIVEQLGRRWNQGTLVLRPSDPTLQAKEIEIEVFFHKIVLMRNNLRLLEQKINTSETLSSAERVEWQQYITRCYGSMTTFNVLFQNKEDQFRT